MFCMSMWIHNLIFETLCIYTHHQEAVLKYCLAVKYKNAETLHKGFQADSLNIETLLIIWNLNFQEHHQMLTVPLRFGWPYVWPPVLLSFPQ